MNSPFFPDQTGIGVFATPFRFDIADHPADADLSPGHREWLPVLHRLGVTVAEADRIAARAAENGTDFQSELLATGDLEEAAVFREIALHLGIPYLARIDPRRLLIQPEHAMALLRRRAWHAPVKVEERDGRSGYILVPERIPLGQMRRMIAKSAALRARLRVAAPGTLRSALLARIQPGLAAKARNGLYERFPAFSARIVADARQGLVLGALLVVLALSLAFAPHAALSSIHVFTSLLFLGCVALRFAAVKAAQPGPPERLASTPPHLLPDYTVLVALHREAEVVPQLLSALDRLVWPRAKLEVKLVCEADDHETLGALSTRWLPPYVEVVAVPAGGPRTKPKALNYALPLVRSGFVVLYDAEDQPHPLQLLEAWHRFSEAGPDLACLQAPLEISNAGEGRLPELFAFEYRALFRSLLPWLSGRRIVLPLGGTSNHFRTAALLDVGGWDPYNVTEDADLGIRLVRFGYRVDTISLPTQEDAPLGLSTWVPQRTRWFKGWLQTWLVHMRDPMRLAADLGVRSFLVAQILMAGLVLSALVHPLLLVAILFLVVDLTLQEPVSGWPVALLTLDLVNIVCGYVSFLMLGWHALKPPERRSYWRIVLWTPVYWMLLSAAAWRAAFQLWRKPHLWEKTPHQPSRIPHTGQRLTPP